MDGDAPPDDPCSCSSTYRLFHRHRSLHHILGDGTLANIILWKKPSLSITTIIIFTAAWFLFQKSGLSFLTICSDVLLILILLQFARANATSLLNKQLKPLPELVVSEEMVNTAAATFRARVNSLLMIAHDITLGKDFRLFFQVLGFLWLLSVVGNFCSFITCAYIGMILCCVFPVSASKEAFWPSHCLLYTINMRSVWIVMLASFTIISPSITKWLTKM